MNKFLFVLLLPLLMLTACGTIESSWENEEIKEASHPLLSDEVVGTWKVSERKADGTLIQLKVTKQDGKPIEKFDLNHEKLLHLIIVSKDLSYFNHIHPEYKGNGLFEIRNDFPAGGEYKLIADFKPTGGGSMTKMDWVRVKGNKAAAVPVTVDDRMVKTINGKRISLSTDSLVANKDLTLKFSLTDELTNQPITDLEPYLGSIGHVVVLSEDGERYLHVHAADGQGSGPEALFETEFPKSGVYKIWAQFQKDDEVFTVPYVINVP